MSFVVRAQPKRNILIHFTFSICVSPILSCCTIALACVVGVVCSILRSYNTVCEARASLRWSRSSRVGKGSQSSVVRRKLFLTGVRFYLLHHIRLTSPIFLPPTFSSNNPETDIIISISSFLHSHVLRLCNWLAKNGRSQIFINEEIKKNFPINFLQFLYCLWMWELIGKNHWWCKVASSYWNKILISDWTKRRIFLVVDGRIILYWILLESNDR